MPTGLELHKQTSHTKHDQLVPQWGVVVVMVVVGCGGGGEEGGAWFVTMARMPFLSPDIAPAAG